MKLTTNQINQIDETLVLNKVIYDDIKLELTDHIASDIEEIMTSQEVSYEVGFMQAFEKWKAQLKPKTGFWAPGKNRFLFFESNVEPKLVNDKLEKISKSKTLNSLVISLAIVGLIMGSIKFNDIKNVLPIIKQVYVILCFGMIVLLVLGRMVISQFKSNTIFGFLFKKGCFQSIWIIVLGLYMLSGIFDKIISDKYYITLFLINFGFVNSVFTLRLLYKHFQFEKKLSKA